MRYRTPLLAGLAAMSVASILLAQPAAGASGSAAASSRALGAMIERGEDVAARSECVACHTEPGGTPMTGGLELKTPMGVLYTTNITPDARTGIGNYSFEQFDRAVRPRVGPNEHELYHWSYAKIGDEDMRALYAYLMKGVAPVEHPTKPAHKASRGSAPAPSPSP